MNCKSFRKYTGAFADGELDVPLNLEALEHLNMCPACAHRVDDVTSSKRALTDMWSHEVAPNPLRSSVADALCGVMEKDNVTDYGLTYSPSWQTRSRFLVPLAIAAAILFYVSIWQRWNSDDLSSGTMTVVTAQAVSDIRNQHQDCALTRGTEHHNPLLSRNPVQLASQLSGLTNLSVVVPVLSQYGFELVGGEKCGIQGRVGGHVLYRSPTTNEFLSVFSTTRIVELIPNQPAEWRERAYFASEDDNSLTVVAWHESDRTISLSANLSKQTLLEMANDTLMTSLEGKRSYLASATTLNMN